MSIRIADGKLLLVEGKAAINDECCCEEYETLESTCMHCGNNRIPRYLQLVVQGVTRCGACPDCRTVDTEIVNGTYILESSGNCWWFWELDPPTFICYYDGFYYWLHHWAVVVWDSVSSTGSYNQKWIVRVNAKWTRASNPLYEPQPPSNSFSDSGKLLLSSDFTGDSAELQDSEVCDSLPLSVSNERPPCPGPPFDSCNNGTGGTATISIYGG